MRRCYADGSCDKCDRPGLGAGDPPLVGSAGCLPPTSAEAGGEVLRAVVVYPKTLLLWIVDQPLLAVPFGGAVAGLYFLGKAYGKEQRKGRRR